MLQSTELPAPSWASPDGRSEQEGGLASAVSPAAKVRGPPTTRLEVREATMSDHAVLVVLSADSWILAVIQQRSARHAF